MHLGIGNTVSTELLEQADECEKSKKYAQLAVLIDQEIYRNYKLWKTNYMAYDLLMKSQEYTDHYSKEDMEQFTGYMNETIESVSEGPRRDIESLFLRLYANPVINKKSTE
jgi:hypothetical protein